MTDQNTGSATETARNAANRAAEAGAREMDKNSEAARKMAGKAADVANTANRETAGVAQHAAKTVRETVQSGMAAAAHVAERSAGQLNHAMGMSGQRADEMSEAGHHAVRAGAEAAKLGADTAQQATQSGIKMGVKAAEHSLDHFARTFGFAGDDAGQLAQRSSRNVEAISNSGTALAQGFKDLSREWMELTQAGFQRNLDGFRALMGCRTLPDMIAVGSDMMRGNLEFALTKGQEMAQRSVQVAEQATQKIKAAA